MFGPCHVNSRVAESPCSKKWHKLEASWLERLVEWRTWQICTHLNKVNFSQIKQIDKLIFWLELYHCGIFFFKPKGQSLSLNLTVRDTINDSSQKKEIWSILDQMMNNVELQETPTMIGHNLITHTVMGFHIYFWSLAISHAWVRLIT